MYTIAIQYYQLYFILQKREVLDFIKQELNRQLYLAYVVLSLLSPNIQGVLSLILEDQYIQIAILSILFSTLELSTNSKYVVLLFRIAIDYYYYKRVYYNLITRDLQNIRNGTIYLVEESSNRPSNKDKYSSESSNRAFYILQ